MKGWLYLIFLLPGICFAQSITDVRLNSAHSVGELSCYDVQLNYHGDEVSLASQNYRLFYDAMHLDFEEEKSTMFLPSDQYTFNVIQHNDGVDASGIGGLPFEEHLGFINATVIFNDPRFSGLKLKSDEQWVSVIQFCFQQIEKGVSGQIVLARESKTAAYGRAFVELSLADANGSIATLPIAKYIDINPE